jgi:UDPglucose 6-dehydrogenase
VDKIRVAVTGRRQGSLARRRLALFGLTFKAGTGDLRDSPVILTEWPEFRTLDWPRLAALANAATLVDTRNLIDPDVAVRAGFNWVGLGRRPIVP